MRKCDFTQNRFLFKICVNMKKKRLGMEIDKKLAQVPEPNKNFAPAHALLYILTFV